MAEPYVGQIISVGFPWAPLNWFQCDGKLYPISEYTTLYSVLGTTYGGDGLQTFAVPNLNGRVPLGAGQGQGLSRYDQGQIGGTESVTLLGTNTPSHNHTIAFSATASTSASPTLKPAPGLLSVGVSVAAELPGGFYAKVAGTVPLRGDSITSSQDGGQAHENRQQYLALNYIIAWTGIFPSRG